MTRRARSASASVSISKPKPVPLIQSTRLWPSAGAGFQFAGLRVAAFAQHIAHRAGDALADFARGVMAAASPGCAARRPIRPPAPPRRAAACPAVGPSISFGKAFGAVLAAVVRRQKRAADGADFRLAGAAVRHPQMRAIWRRPLAHKVQHPANRCLVQGHGLAQLAPIAQVAGRVQVPGDLVEVVPDGALARASAPWPRGCAGSPRQRRRSGETKARGHRRSRSARPVPSRRPQARPVRSG